MEARAVHIVAVALLLMSMDGTVAAITTRASKEQRINETGKQSGSNPFPLFNWDTVPLFWHAADSHGPFNTSTLDFIARFPLATIEKMQAQQQAPVNTGAEQKILAAAKQIKAHSPGVKVLFYLNSIMDWDMYDLHAYCEHNQRAMWLYGDDDNPVMLRGQHTFNVTSESTRQVWINTLLAADKSGVIDGAFVDRGAVPESFPRVSPERMAAWKQGHDIHMAEMQKQLGPDKIVISNNNDYESVNARMFERFFLKNLDKHSPYLDLLALMHEATYPHLAEVHGEPCSSAVLNTTLAAYLIGAGEYAYYACTSGWTVQTGWMDWHDEYSKNLGKPLSNATTIKTPLGYCSNKTTGVDGHGADSAFWSSLQREATRHNFRRPPLHKWIDAYWQDHPNEPQPVFGRRFASGTCVTLDFSTSTPTPCIAWSDGSVTGSVHCK